MKVGQVQFLRGCLGDGGYESLVKTIQREGYSIPTEMQEQYLAMMVVPHSLLAWVITTTKKLDEGENKEVEVPGHVGTKLLLNKVKSDIYTGYLHKDGQILHRFTGLSIPQLAGHLMTCLEMYDGVDAKVASSPKVVDGIAPLIERLVQERFSSPAPVINITINTGAPAAPKVEAPGFVTEPPVMAGPAAVEETSEESSSKKAKKDEESEVSDKTKWEKVTPGRHLVGVDPKKQPAPKWDEAKGQWISQTPAKKDEDKAELATRSSHEARLSDGSGVATGTVKSEASISKLAAEIVEKAIKESKPKAFGLTLSKEEMEARCPDCGGSEFENEKFVGCMCMSSMQDCKVKVVKNEDGSYRLQFGKRWTSDDLKMLLDIIKRDSHE